MKYPKPHVDLAKIRRDYHAAVAATVAKQKRKSLSAQGRLIARPGDARQQHGQHAGQENTVERSRPADGRDWRAEARDLTQIRKIGADQHAETAADIGERAGVGRERRPRRSP